MRIINNALICIVLCVCITEKIKAQTFFEDAKGRTSINLPIGGMVRLNTADESLKFGYYYSRSDKNFVIGIDVTGKSNNGIAPIMGKEKLSPDANFNFNFGFKNIFTGSSKSTFDYLNIKSGVGTSKYKLIDVNTAFENQVRSESFTKFNLGVSYNYYLNGNMIFAVYTGYDRTNNISDLSKLTVKETTSSASDTTGKTIRTTIEEYTAWQGQLESINQLSLYFDYVYIPDFLSNRVAFSLYSRSSFKGSLNMTNCGLGIYLNEKDEPLKIIGGIIYEFQDVFNAKESGTSFSKKGIVSIVLGYNF